MYKECGDGVHPPPKSVFKDLRASFFIGAGRLVDILEKVEDREEEGRLADQAVAWVEVRLTQ